MKIITFQATVGGFKIFKKRYGLHETVLGAAALAGQHMGAVSPAVRGGDLTIRGVREDRPLRLPNLFCPQSPCWVKQVLDGQQ